MNKRLTERLIEAEIQLDRAIIDIYKLQLRLSEIQNTERPSFSFIYNAYLTNHSVENYNPPNKKAMKQARNIQPVDNPTFEAAK